MCAHRACVHAESLDQLKLTPLDKSLLQTQAANRLASQTASFRIALLGGHSAAAVQRPDVVAQRQAAGRALRDTYEQQGFKKRRSTKSQRANREANAVARARATFKEALGAQANSNRSCSFNDLVDAPDQAPSRGLLTNQLRNLSLIHI